MADAQAPASGGNMFTRKIGPLPMWGWVSIIGGGIIVWALYARKKAAASQANQQQQTGTGTAQQPPVIYQGYSYINVPQQGPSTSGQPAQTTPPTATPHPAEPPVVTPAQPVPRPAQPAATGLNVQYLPGGFPGGLTAASAAGAPAQTSGNAYNFSWNQIGQMGFPNLRGLTLAQAQKALAAYDGGAYKIQNVSGTPGTKIVSFTPYSTGQVNIGLS